jgi:hypothetical protein
MLAGLISRCVKPDGSLQDLIQRQGAAGQPCGERFPLQVLHDEVVDAVLLANVVEGADVGMLQAGDGVGFALESLAQGGGIG